MIQTKATFKIKRSSRMNLFVDQSELLNLNSLGEGVIVFNATFNNMMVSFIGGRNRSTQRKPPTCHKSLTNFYHIMLYQYTSTREGFELWDFQTQFYR